MGDKNRLHEDGSIDNVISKIHSIHGSKSLSKDKKLHKLEKMLEYHKRATYDGSAESVELILNAIEEVNYGN